MFMWNGGPELLKLTNKFNGFPVERLQDWHILYMDLVNTIYIMPGIFMIGSD